MADANTDLTPEQLREIASVRAFLLAARAEKDRAQNPSIRRDFGGSFEIRFWVPNKAEPLHWIGTGFKDLTRVCAEPETFASVEEAEAKVRAEILAHINEWRDQGHLVCGWG